MTRILYWSDLHTEFAAFPLPDYHDVAPIDAVCLGGDTAVGDKHLDMLFAIWQTYQVPVSSIRGNHELYGCVWEDQEEKDARRLAAWAEQGIPIQVLDGTCAYVNDVRIIGATLWTDMRVMGDNGIFAIPKVERGLNDYHQIRVRDQHRSVDDIGGLSRTRPLRATDTIAKHVSDREAIFAHLQTPWQGKTLVMTHHLPTPLCVHPMYRTDPITAGFASDLTEAIIDSTVDVWLYGHTHKKTDVDIARSDGGVCAMRSNIRGYPHEADPTQFSPTFVLTL